MLNNQKARIPLSSRMCNEAVVRSAMKYASTELSWAVEYKGKYIPEINYVNLLDSCECWTTSCI